MHRVYTTISMIALFVLAGTLAASTAKSFNQWQGSEASADWSNPYKWKLQHVPSGDETVHFRQDRSVITVNKTVELDNGMMLYGQDLFLEGHGNINLSNPIPHRRTVNIPASATGYANLTMSDTLSLHGRVALAAKAFGTASSKGSVTLKDRSNIMGALSIGNNGSGSGQVFIKDKATFRISDLELNTRAEQGGMAEIHILGGTVSLETGTNTFAIFMADPSRKIIIGESGTLRIDTQLPADQKKAIITEMINRHRIVAATDCRLTPPEIHDDMVMMSAAFADQSPLATGTPVTLTEYTEVTFTTTAGPASPDTKENPSEIAQSSSLTEHRTSKLESLLQDMQTNQQQEVAMDSAPEVINDAAATEPSPEESSVPVTGYIVFISAILFFMRPQKSE